MIIRARAPLRLGLAGGGTDVSPYSDLYGGCVLNATIDRYAYCTIEPTQDRQVQFIAADRQESLSLPRASELPLDGKFNLYKAVYNRIVREFMNDQPLSFRMTTFSDAPAGSGLGTSSTLVTAIIGAFAEWLKLPLGEYDIAYLAYQIERIDVGLAGGKQDQYAATFGGFNFMEFHGDRVVVNPLRVRPSTINELQVSLLLYYTGISRDSAAIISQQIENAAQKKADPTEAMHALKADALAMKEQLLKGDLRTWGQILGRSWEAKKRMSTAITNRKIDEAFETALAAGALSGKVSGAGGGGYIMFMIDPCKREDVSRAMAKLDGHLGRFQFTPNGMESWTLR